MSANFESILLELTNNEFYSKKQNELDINLDILEYVQIINVNMKREFLHLSIVDEFIEKYFKFDDKIIIEYKDFINAIKDKIITKEILYQLLNNEISSREIQFKISINGLNISISEMTNYGKINCSDKLVYDFLKLTIINWNLESDIAINETELEYLNRINKIYFPDRIIAIKELKNKICLRYYSDILKIHSLLSFNLIDKKIINKFFEYLSLLFYDRDDGYDNKKINLDKPFDTTDLNIYTLLQNTEYQVNLFCFKEEQQEPNYKIRTDIILIKELLEIGRIFNLLNYDVIILGSNLKTNKNNQGYWENIPYKFNSIYKTIIEKYPILPFNMINIYLQVDFRCL